MVSYSLEVPSFSFREDFSISFQCIVCVRARACVCVCVRARVCVFVQPHLIYLCVNKYSHEYVCLWICNCVYVCVCEGIGLPSRWLKAVDISVLIWGDLFPFSCEWYGYDMEHLFLCNIWTSHLVVTHMCYNLGVRQSVCLRAYKAAYVCVCLCVSVCVCVCNSFSHMCVCLYVSIWKCVYVYLCV